jgi:type IV secretory pathway TraG/TraD family ATPase VirD4
MNDILATLQNGNGTPVVFGKTDSRPDAPLIKVPVHGNILTFAPARSGVTSSFIAHLLAPGVAAASKSLPGGSPAIVFDPNGEMLAATRKRREELGRAVIQVSPPRNGRSLKASDVDLRPVLANKADLFVTYDASRRDEVAPWLRAVAGQPFGLAGYRSPPVTVQVIIDEADEIGRVPEMRNIFRIGVAGNLQYWLRAFTPGSLKAAYGRDADWILVNANAVAFRPAWHMPAADAKALRELIGPQSKLPDDEIRRMERDEFLLIHNSCRRGTVLRSRLANYREDAAFAGIPIGGSPSVADDNASDGVA